MKGCDMHTEMNMPLMNKKKKEVPVKMGSDPTDIMMGKVNPRVKKSIKKRPVMKPTKRGKLPFDKENY